jgi:hypothetical protein
MQSQDSDCSFLETFPSSHPTAEFYLLHMTSQGDCEHRGPQGSTRTDLSRQIVTYSTYPGIRTRVALCLLPMSCPDGREGGNHICHAGLRFTPNSESRSSSKSRWSVLRSHRGCFNLARYRQLRILVEGRPDRSGRRMAFEGGFLSSL